MNYPIPANTEEILALSRGSVNEEIIATAIAGVVNIARQEGKTLEDIIAGVLQDDRLLDLDRRKWLSDLVVHAWSILP
jgi:hypothetical protein